MTDASTPTAATPDMTKTSITMVLDRSGSMNSCRKATIDAVNKYLEEAKSSDLKTADFELMIFDAKSIDVIRSGVLADVAGITEKDFEPRDMTPLYDAIGRGIDSLDKRNGDGKAILVIVTDGAENQSRKHTHASISELIQGRQDKGWLILFLGAGLENAQQGTSLGIRAANVANIGLDEAIARSHDGELGRDERALLDIGVALRCEGLCRVREVHAEDAQSDGRQVGWCRHRRWNAVAARA